MKKKKKLVACSWGAIASLAPVIVPLMVIKIVNGFQNNFSILIKKFSNDIQ